MTNSGGHNKFESCLDCPHRERKEVDGKIYDCHDHCEGYAYRKKQIDAKRNLIREKKFESGITFLTGQKDR